MNTFERWFLRRIIAKAVTQGPDHASNVIDIYRLVYSACRHEFAEDNNVTINDFLAECFRASKDKPS